MRIEPRSNKELLVVVDEGDNAALEISSARLLLPAYRLRFYRPASGDLKLVYGRDDLQPPKYDLALLAREVLGAPASEIAAERASSSTDGDSDAPSFVSPTFFWVLLGAAVIVLLGLIVRLVKI